MPPPSWPQRTASTTSSRSPGSYFHGEAVVFSPPAEDLAGFAFDVLENVEGNLVEFRLLEQHGELFFALVPLSEEAASALADALSRCARWRARR